MEIQNSKLPWTLIILVGSLLAGYSLGGTIEAWRDDSQRDRQLIWSALDVRVRYVEDSLRTLEEDRLKRIESKLSELEARDAD